MAGSKFIEGAQDRFPEIRENDYGGCRTEGSEGIPLVENMTKNSAFFDQLAKFFFWSLH